MINLYKKAVFPKSKVEFGFLEFHQNDLVSLSLSFEYIAKASLKF